MSVTIIYPWMHKAICFHTFMIFLIILNYFFIQVHCIFIDLVFLLSCVLYMSLWLGWSGQPHPTYWRRSRLLGASIRAVPLSQPIPVKNYFENRLSREINVLSRTPAYFCSEKKMATKERNWPTTLLSNRLLIDVNKLIDWLIDWVIIIIKSKIQWRFSC